MMADVTMTFGAAIGRHPTRDEVLRAARSAEERGFDRVTVADHLGSNAPFAVLAAAAAVTERIRLRTYVLDAFFWNPALLAREVATLDQLSAGRFELGLGAGHMRHEHDDAGLPFPPIAERVAELERVLVEVRERLARPDHRPAPVQPVVPVSVGAWGAASLSVAVRHAEIISLTGMVQVRGARAGTFELSDVDEVDRRVDRLRTALAGDRPAGLPEPVLDSLLQHVSVDADPEQAAAALLAEWSAQLGAEVTMSVPDLLASPFLLFAATPREALDELVRRGERWGISSWCTHTAAVPALAEVVAVQRARSSRAPGPVEQRECSSAVRQLPTVTG